MSPILRQFLPLQTWSWTYGLGYTGPQNEIENESDGREEEFLNRLPLRTAACFPLIPSCLVRKASIY